MLWKWQIPMVPFTLMFAVLVSVLAQECKSPENPLLQSQSCNEGSKVVLPTTKCCPLCCQNSSGFCALSCEIANCISDTSPSKVWSRAYTSTLKSSFMLVLQRPQKWNVPDTCVCGVDGGNRGSLVGLAEEPLFKKGPFSSPFEENLSHIRLKDKNMHGCCTPPDGYDWYTRNYRCTLPQPCNEPIISLFNKDQLVEKIPIELVEKIGSSKQQNENLICIPRYSRDYAKKQLQNNHLLNWLDHHLQRDFGRVLLYSDDCLRETLSHPVLDSLKVKLSLQRSSYGKAQDVSIDIVDISTSRDIPVWYHNQVLAMKDCWARGVAGEANWIASIDIDEFLILPKSWSYSRFFSSDHDRITSLPLTESMNAFERQYNPSTMNFESAEQVFDTYKPSISLASINTCAKVSINERSKCEGIWKGHRKYLIRALPSANLVQSIDSSSGLSKQVYDDVSYNVELEKQEIIINKLLKPPQFIHGDPGEYRLSLDSGMYVMHFSRCEVSDCPSTLEFDAWISEKAKGIVPPIASSKLTYNSNAQLLPCYFDQWKYS